MVLLVVQPQQQGKPGFGTFTYAAMADYNRTQLPDSGVSELEKSNKAMDRENWSVQIATEVTFGLHTLTGQSHCCACG